MHTILKTYRGTRGADGRAEVTVTGSGASLPLDSRRDLRDHSPDGVEWGYPGSGPAQLALALLADHFGVGPGRARLAMALYQDFKFAVVARLPRDGWTLTGEQVGQALCRLASEDEAHFWDRMIGALDTELFASSVGATGADPEPAELENAAVEIITGALPVSRDYARRRAAIYYHHEAEGAQR